MTIRCIVVACVIAIARIASAQPQNVARAPQVAPYFGGVVGIAAGNDRYCSGYDSCNSGGRSHSLLAGITFSGERSSVAIEAAFLGQLTTSRDSLGYGDLFSYRSTRGSLLYRYAFLSTRRYSVGAGGGISVLGGVSNGVVRFKATQASTNGGWHAYDDRHVAWGPTAAFDVAVSVGQRFSLIVPVRITSTPERVDQTRSYNPYDSVYGITYPSQQWPGRLSIQIGAAMSLKLPRSNR